jgi:hypothetical protein
MKRAIIMPSLRCPKQGLLKNKEVLMRWVLLCAVLGLLIGHYCTLTVVMAVTALVVVVVVVMYVSLKEMAKLVAMCAFGLGFFLVVPMWVAVAIRDWEAIANALSGLLR